jgi:hypothetical protein
LDEQRSLFRDFEKLPSERAFGAVAESWEPDLDWLRGS